MAENDVIAEHPDERLAAEVALFRERDALTRKALQTESDGPLQFAALIVRQQRDKALAEISRLTGELEQLQATLDLAERQYAEQTTELRGDRDRYKAAHESAQRALVRVETQRDDLRAAVLVAAVVDPDEAGVDTDYAALLSAMSSRCTAALPDDAEDRLWSAAMDKDQWTSMRADEIQALLRLALNEFRSWLWPAPESAIRR